VKKSEEREPISRHMGFPSSIASYNPHPHYNTGKQKERTKMTYNIEDKYRITYRNVWYNNELGREHSHIISLFVIPAFLETLSQTKSMVMIISCEKVSE
jgi:hypothetical protein